MSFGGGGGDTQTTQTNPAIRQDIPLQQDMIDISQQQLNAFRPYARAGAGYLLANQSPLGQVYTPGPNQSNFGNPYTTTGHEPYFGTAAPPPTNLGFGGSMTGGQGAGGGGGQNFASNYNNSGAKLGGYVPQGLAQLPAGRAYAHGPSQTGPMAGAPPPPAGMPGVLPGANTWPAGKDIPNPLPPAPTDGTNDPYSSLRGGA